MMAGSGFYLDEFPTGTRNANAVLDDEGLDPMSAGIFGAFPATHRPVITVIKTAPEPVIVRRFPPRIGYLPLKFKGRRCIRLRTEPQTVSLTNRAIV
jgi:hypothetical protein